VLREAARRHIGALDAVAANRSVDIVLRLKAAAPERTVLARGAGTGQGPPAGRTDDIEGHRHNMRNAE
jgi:hypothetical protein